MNFLTNFFESLIADIINQVLTLALMLLKAVEITPTQMQYIPHYTDLQHFLIYTSLSWLVVLYLKELLLNQFDMLGDNYVNPLVILKNTLFAGGLVSLTPIIMTSILFPMLTITMGAVDSTIGSVSAISNDLQSHLALTAGEAAATTGFFAVFPEIGFFGAALIAASYMVVILLIGIQSGFRWMELIFLSLIGPVLAVSKATNGQYWDLWLRETAATVFSQVIQNFAVVLGMEMALNTFSLDKINGGHAVSPFMYIILAFTAFVFALRGPKTLRTLLGAQPNGIRGAQAVAGMAKNVAVVAA